MPIFHLYFDGSCIRNPNGIGSIGVYYPELELEYDEVIGEGEGITSNVAEWTAIKKGLEIIEEQLAKGDQLEVIGDSQLVIRQINKEYKIKDPKLRAIATSVQDQIDKLLKRSVDISFKWVRRDKNSWQIALLSSQ